MSDYELKRINALPEASAINDSDVFAIDSAAGTKKVTWETLKGEVDADISEAVSNKADTDGTYPDMAVGSVLGTNTVTDKEPYFLRPSASIGDREFDTLVGGTLGWNQLVQNISPTSTKNGVTATNNGDGSVTLSGTATELTAIEVTRPVSQQQNHVYYVGKGSNFALYMGYQADGVNGLSKWNRADGSSLMYALIPNGATVNEKIYPQCIDLTALFGPTIADYIYSLEQATAGAGVAWVRKYLPNDYYAYCAPTLKHVSGVSAHVMRDANNNVIGNYPIDSTWTGMGIPKLDSDNKLYFDGDRYASDGTVTERFGIVDLGTLEWSLFSANEHIFTANYPYVVHSTANLITAKYAVNTYSVGTNRTDKTINAAAYFSATGAISIKDTDYSTAADLKTSLSGVYLVYEKQTATTSTASPFTSPQICDKSGTEEYVTSGLVPVGHETEYVENLADKLTDIPDLPTTAGTYRLKVTVSGGVPSYSWVSA